MDCPFCESSSTQYLGQHVQDGILKESWYCHNCNTESSSRINYPIEDEGGNDESTQCEG